MKRQPDTRADHLAGGSGVLVRSARPGDNAAALVFDAARAAYCSAAGSEDRARAILQRLWSTPGHSVSFEHALVAELEGRVVGVLIAFPARDRYRLHFALLRKGLRDSRMSRWPLLALTLPQLIAATPRPPRRAYYVATLAVARQARRRGVASALAHRAELLAARRGFPVIAAHTGSRHLVARAALEHYGARSTKQRSWGYALYTKSVAEPAPRAPYL